MDRRPVIDPPERQPDLADLLETLEPLDEDFPEIADPPARPENLL